uniref:Uncharacterized protein n=1 Tax=Anguilla anguilla TaxID=7936 RepID=A0A0E9SCL4_ANGAN
MPIKVVRIFVKPQNPTNRKEEILFLWLIVCSLFDCPPVMMIGLTLDVPGLCDSDRLCVLPSVW